MTLYDDYRNTDYLPDISFIAGTEMYLEFPVYDENMSLVDISSGSMTWVLGLYGQPDTRILQKEATILDSNTFLVTLTEDDTISLGGSVYLQQMIVTDADGIKIRPGQGIVTIRKAIPVE